MHRGLCNMNHVSFFTEANLIEIGVYFEASRRLGINPTRLFISIFFSKGAVVYYYQAIKLGFILSIISKSLGKLIKYC